MDAKELQAIEMKYLAACNLAKIVSAKVSNLRERMKAQTEAVKALTRQIKHHRNKLDDSSYQIINQCVPSAAGRQQGGE